MWYVEKSHRFCKEFSFRCFHMLRLKFIPFCLYYYGVASLIVIVSFELSLPFQTFVILSYLVVLRLDYETNYVYQVFGY